MIIPVMSNKRDGDQGSTGNEQKKMKEMPYSKSEFIKNVRIGDRSV